MTKHSFISKTLEHKLLYALSFAIIAAPCAMMADEGDEEHTNVTRKVVNDPCFPCTPGSHNAVTQSALALGSYSIVQTVLTPGSGTSGVGVFTLQSGTKFAVVEAVGAGGGSGGVTAVLLATAPGAGSGSYSRRVLTAAQIGATVAYTVGIGGSGGVTLPSAGSPGGTTHFGSLVTAPGGLGSSGASTIIQTGSAGGALGVGGIVAGFAGGSSITGTTGNFTTGEGADSPGGFGEGGNTQISLNAAVAVGQSGQGYGSGASGGSAPSGASAAGVVGGTGAGGIIIITEYLFQ